MNTVRIWRTIGVSLIEKHNLNFLSRLFKKCNDLFPMPEEDGSYSNHGRSWDFEGYYFEPNSGEITQKLRFDISTRQLK